MAVDAGQGFVDILPRADKFLGSLNAQITKSITSATSSVTTTSQKLLKGATIGIAALGIAAVAAIGKGIQATVEWAAEIRSLQRVTGQTAESASALAAAGNVLGISVDQLNVGFGLLAKNIVNGAPNLTKYGIAVRDANGKMLGFDQVLGEVQDKFATLQPGAEQAAFAMNVFGRSGKALIPVLARGRDGLKELEDAAISAGLVLSQGDLDAARDLSIAQRELGEAFKGAAITIGKDFIPVVTDGANAITAMVEELQKVPAPVLEAGLRFAVLAGSLTLAVKVGQIFAGIWGGVVTKLAASVVANQALAASELEVAGATETANLTIGQQVLALQAQARAAAEASTAGTAFATTSVTGFAATASAALAAVAPLAAFAYGIYQASQQIKALNLLSEDPPDWDAFFQPAIDDFNKMASSIGSPVFSLGPLGDFADQLLNFSDGSTEFAKFKTGLALIKSEFLEGGLTADDAAVKVQELADNLGIEIPQGADKFVQAFGPVLDDTEKLDSLLSSLGLNLKTAGGAFKELAAISGETSKTFRDTFTASLTEAKAAADQLGEPFDGTKASVEAFGAASTEALSTARAAIVDFTSSATDSFASFTDDALSGLLDVKNLTAGEVTGAFEDAAAQTRQFGRDLLEISRTGGTAGKALAEQLLSLGPAAAGFAGFVADASAKAQRSMIEAFGGGQRAAESAASRISKVLVGTLKDVRDILAAIAKHWHIDVDLGDHVSNPLDKMAAKIKALTDNPHVVDIFLRESGRGAAGGIIPHGATGFIAKQPVLVGEGTQPTFAGRGAEAVIPFDQRGLGILSEALEKALSRSGGGGASRPEVVEIHVHTEIDGKEAAHTITRHQMRGRMVSGR